MKKKIYLVGGAVRDMVLGIKSYDKDYLAVGYSKEDFTHLPYVGKNFSVFLLPDGNEIAMARSEKKINPGYNGFEINTNNISLEEDLSRRDLTINSMAYDEENKNIIDPFNGIHDIENKIFRHTSNAFSEDPIRVLRIARLYAKYNSQWVIAIETQELIANMKNELCHLQKDRVYKELVKVMAYKTWFTFFEILYELKVLQTIFPMINDLFSSQYLNKVKETSNKIDEIYLKYVLLYMFIIKSDYDKIEIQLPKKTLQTIILFLKRFDELKKFSTLSYSKQLNFFTSFKKDQKLFLSFLNFSYHFYKNFDIDRYLDCYIKLSTYNPKKWIEKQKIKPSKDLIQQHKIEFFIRNCQI